EAEVLFLDPADVPNATEALEMFGFRYEVDPDVIDEHGPTVFGWLTGTTELSENELGDRLLDIVAPLGGDVVTWGYVQKPVADSHVRCIACGREMGRGDHCSECVARGLGPCEACEGASLFDVEEDSQ